MKDFTNWGVKVRKFPECNYHAVWVNLKTLRLGEGQASELPANKSEFYDVSLGKRCNLGCPFCYTSALKSGLDYSNVCEKAEWFFGSMNPNDKPFQIAIGTKLFFCNRIICKNIGDSVNYKNYLIKKVCALDNSNIIKEQRQSDEISEVSNIDANGEA
jgi:hypothetical protein